MSQKLIGKKDNAERERRYALQVAAQKRVEGRVVRVLDRVIVAATFTGFHTGTAAQVLHARRFAEWGDKEPEEPYVRLDSADADELVRILASLFTQAYKP